MPSRITFSETARKQWLAYGLYILLGLIGLLTAAWATWLNLSISGATDGLITSLGGSLSPTSIPILPDFAPLESDTSLSRQANIFTEFPLRPRVDVVRYTVPFLLSRSVFGLIMTVGHVAFAVLVWRMFAGRGGGFLGPTLFKSPSATDAVTGGEA